MCVQIVRNKDDDKGKDLGNYLNEHTNVYARLQCYSKADSASKTFKFSLPPHHYRKLCNPSLWYSGIIMCQTIL